VRAGTHTADWIYQRSTNGGKTFQKPVIIFKYEKITRRIYVTWYVKCFKGNKEATRKADRIGCFASWHHHQTGQTKEGGNAHGPDRRNIYYIEIETSSGKFYNIHNKQLKSPITLKKANMYALVYESEGTFVEPLDATFNKHGDPEVLIHQYINPSQDGWDRNRVSTSFLYTSFNNNTRTWYIPIRISEGEGPGFASGHGVFDKTEYNEVSSVIVSASKIMSYFDGSMNATGSEPVPSFTKNKQKLKTNTQMSGPAYLDIRNPQKEGWLMLADKSIGGTEIAKKYYMNIFLYGDDGFVHRNHKESSDLWKRCWEATTNDECFVMSYEQESTKS